MSTEYTYMREAVPATNTGQCPCCLKPFRSTKYGVMIRHGWSETGRQAGQYGHGVQWGECIGWNRRPLEQTDADALEVLVELSSRIEKVQADIIKHTAGVKHYGDTFRVPENSRLSRKENYEDALRELGLTFKVESVSVRKQGHRVYYEPMWLFTVKVTPGFEGVYFSKGYAAFSIMSYDKIQARSIHQLEGLHKDLTRQAEDVKKAIEHHRANPSNGKPVVKKGPAIHYQTVKMQAFYNKKTREREEELRPYDWCASKSHYKKTTDVVGKVTCKKCLSSMKKENLV